jgi:hypothetical protein
MKPTSDMMSGTGSGNCQPLTTTAEEVLTMAMSRLSQARLKELLDYNPDTGVFTWRVSPTNTVPVGAVAGSINSVSGYRRIRVNGEEGYAHRLAFLYMEDKWPTHDVDHKNHDRDDNRWCNLREATRRENLQNMTGIQGNIYGVTFDKSRGRWQVKISVEGVERQIGRYDNLLDACCARKSAEIEHGYHSNHGR